MAVHINEDCINCGVCVPVCPNRAIAELDRDDSRILPGQPNVIFVVAPHLCTECVGFYDEPQCASLCPTFAIPTGELHPEEPAELEAKARTLGDYREQLGLPREYSYRENPGLEPRPGEFGPSPQTE